MVVSKKSKPINIDIDVELWREVSIKAATDDCTKKEIVESALKAYLKK